MCCSNDIGHQRVKEGVRSHQLDSEFGVDELCPETIELSPCAALRFLTRVLIAPVPHIDASHPEPNRCTAERCIGI